MPRLASLTARQLAGQGAGPRILNLELTVDNPNVYSSAGSDLFGYSVAISGNRAIVGARGEDEPGVFAAGKAYIIDVQTGNVVHTLSNPNNYDTGVSDNFGWGVDIDGDRAIVGTPFEDDAGGSGSGVAYIFDVTTGALLHTLVNPNAFNTSASDQFGRDVAISGDRAIVGAYLEDAVVASSSGKAYIFNVSTGSLIHTLDNPRNSSSDTFGNAVGIDGNYAIVGSPGQDQTNTSGVITAQNAGAAYIFNVTTGTLVHTLENPSTVTGGNGPAQDNFGNWRAVDISGNYAIVGAHQTDGGAGISSSGAAHIFNVTTGALVHSFYNPNAFGTPALDDFGRVVGISGNYCIVGAPREDDEVGTEQGKAYIFNVASGALVHTIDNPNAQSSINSDTNDQFSWAVDIDGGRAIVSTPYEDESNASSSGKAYIFRY